MKSPVGLPFPPCVGLGPQSCPEPRRKWSWLTGCFPVCALDICAESPCLPSCLWSYLLLLLSALPGSSLATLDLLIELVSHPWLCLPGGMALGSPQLITNHHQFFFPGCVSDFFCGRSLCFACLCHLYLLIESSSAEKVLGVMVDKRLNLSWLFECAAQKAKLYPGLHQRKHSEQVKGGDSAPYSAMVRPHLEYCIQLWSPHHKKGVDRLEWF